jgi:hypothetical protein
MTDDSNTALKYSVKVFLSEQQRFKPAALKQHMVEGVPSCSSHDVLLFGRDCSHS